MEGRSEDPGGHLEDREGRRDRRRRHDDSGRRRSKSPELDARAKDRGGTGDGHGRYRDRERERPPTSRRKHHEHHGRQSRKVNERDSRRGPSPDPSAGTPASPHASKSRFSPHHRPSLEHSPPTRTALPYGARALSRWDFAAFEPLFAHYLDLQKQIRLADLDEHQVRGRWKSFVGKWNRGELAEGWYEPEMFLRVVRLGAESQALDDNDDDDGATPQPPPRGGTDHSNSAQVPTPPTSGRSIPDSAVVLDEEDEGGGEEDGGDDWGPALPPCKSSSLAVVPRPGPGIPSLQDLQAKREMAEEDQQAQMDDLRLARKEDRAEQRERLDELLPRADPGSRERRLEKKQAVNDKMRGFRERSPGGDAEVREADLLGGGDGVHDYKRMLVTMQRRKKAWEVRAEEEERAKAAERDEKLRGYREKEEETIARLRELARQRFA